MIFQYENNFTETFKHRTFVSEKVWTLKLVDLIKCYFFYLQLHIWLPVVMKTTNWRKIITVPHDANDAFCFLSKSSVSGHTCIFSVAMFTQSPLTCESNLDELFQCDSVSVCSALLEIIQVAAFCFSTVASQH